MVASHTYIVNDWIGFVKLDNKKGETERPPFVIESLNLPASYTIRFSPIAQMVFSWVFVPNVPARVRVREYPFGMTDVMVMLHSSPHNNVGHY